MPVIYKPFYSESIQDPEVLTALPAEDVPGAETLSEEVEDEIILERDGIHYINNQVLHPDEDTEKALDPKFLDLVESVIKPT
jgi:xanthine dehydrogenase molybdopterin-binding subunit B